MSKEIVNDDGQLTEYGEEVVRRIQQVKDTGWVGDEDIGMTLEWFTGAGLLSFLLDH